MKTSDYFKKILLYLAVIIAVQATRTVLNFGIFKVIEKTPLSDGIFRAAIYAIPLAVYFIFFKNCAKELPLLPDKFNLFYIAVGIFATAAFVVGLFFIDEYTAYTLVKYLTGVIVVPLFEEILFRGYLFKPFEKTKPLLQILSSAFLFGIFHLGYYFDVAYRTSVFSPPANPANIILMKALTGFALGLIFAFLRYKAKNVYTPLMLHVALNSFGA